MAINRLADKDPTLLERFWDNISPEPNSGCWLWTGCTRSGYGTLAISKRAGNNKMVSMHRFAYETWKGPIPPGHYICHRCDVRECCNPDHLFAGTQAENMADMTRKGRRRGKPMAHRAKLSDAAVADIKARLARGEICRVIAESYGVTKWAIFNIKQGRTLQRFANGN